jgi:hypothetical protein
MFFFNLMTGQYNAKIIYLHQHFSKFLPRKILKLENKLFRGKEIFGPKR